MVTINGKQEEAAGMTILAYLQQAGYAPERIVVERNLDIIPRDVGERELRQLLCAYRSEQHGRLDLLRPVLVAFGKELRVQTEFTASRSVRFDSRPDQCYYIYTPLGV